MKAWIIKTLRGIIATHKQGKFPFNCKGFALGEGETHEQGFARVEGELATANTALATAKEAGGKSFYGSLSDEVRKDPSMSKFEKSSNEDIAKSYISLQSKISAKGLTIPGKNATKEEKSAFWKELGRPDTADGYQIELPQDLHKSITSDAESQKAFKGKCHEIGLSAEQTQLLHSWYMTEISGKMKQQDEEDTKVVNETKTALNAKWGTTYEGKLELANRVVNKFGGEKVLELFKEGLGANPLVLEMLSNIGDALSEDVLGPGGKSQYGGLTPAAADAKVKEIMNNPKHPYNDGANPLHKEAVEEVLSLNKIITAATEEK